MYREIFENSPLPEYRGPRREVVHSFLEYASLPDKENLPERLGWAAMTMTGMTFCNAFDEQWDVILELIELAPDDERVLQTIAAGPLEGFLGRFDADVIELVEREAGRDAKFCRTLTGVWKHGMSDAVWARVRALQRSAPDPLSNMTPF